MNKKTFALITAAGRSSRMGGDKKEFILINNIPVIIHAVMPFENSSLIDRIFITYASGQKESFERIIEKADFRTPVTLVEGGEARQKSVYNALLAMGKDPPDIVLIHDGARPLLSEELLESVIESTAVNGACVPVIPLIDSLKKTSEDGIITGHPDRNSFKSAQTPQGFYYSKITEAHREASMEEKEYLDDTEIYSRFKGKVSTVEGSDQNRKITYITDLQFVNAVIKGEKLMRIGQGYDIHRLEEGKKLIIGGVFIPSEKGALAHSDGDVLIHAIIDSLLGAVSEKDIGALFPTSDPAYRDISSRILLKEVVSLIKSRGFAISNIDTTVILEKPKLREHIYKIRETLAEDLETDINSVSVKAKTKETCDAAGREEAVEAFSTVLLKTF